MADKQNQVPTPAEVGKLAEEATKAQIQAAAANSYEQARAVLEQAIQTDKVDYLPPTPQVRYKPSFLERLGVGLSGDASNIQKAQIAAAQMSANLLAAYDQIRTQQIGYQRYRLAQYRSKLAELAAKQDEAVAAATAAGPVGRAEGAKATLDAFNTQVNTERLQAETSAANALATERRKRAGLLETQADALKREMEKSENPPAPDVPEPDASKWREYPSFLEYTDILASGTYLPVGFDLSNRAFLPQPVVGEDGQEAPPGTTLPLKSEDQLDDMYGSLSRMVESAPAEVRPLLRERLGQAVMAARDILRNRQTTDAAFTDSMNKLGSGVVTQITNSAGDVVGFQDQATPADAKKGLVKSVPENSPVFDLVKGLTLTESDLFDDTVLTPGDVQSTSGDLRSTLMNRYTEALRLFSEHKINKQELAKAKMYTKSMDFVLDAFEKYKDIPKRSPVRSRFINSLIVAAALDSVDLADFEDFAAWARQNIGITDDAQITDIYKLLEPKLQVAKQQSRKRKQASADALNISPHLFKY